MAGTWIKVETCLPDKPEVLRIAAQLGIHPDHVVGLCVRFWSWCDTHLRDGQYVGGTLEMVDHHVHHDGFAAAMVAAGWLSEEKSDRLIIPYYIRHLGKSAKARAMNTRRQTASRSVSRKPRDKSATEP